MSSEWCFPFAVTEGSGGALHSGRGGSVPVVKDQALHTKVTMVGSRNDLP